MARKRHGVLVVDGGYHPAVGGTLNTNKQCNSDGSTSLSAIVDPMAGVDLLRSKASSIGTRRRASLLPPSLPPRLLSREQAAEYCGVSPTYFDEVVDDGRMPKPVRLGRRVLWDLRKIDLALDKLDTDNAADDPYARQSV
jgi:predicted DNA-binding transcriptional regulator AlpA